MLFYRIVENNVYGGNDMPGLIEEPVLTNKEIRKRKKEEVRKRKQEKKKEKHWMRLLLQKIQTAVKKNSIS